MRPLTAIIYATILCGGNGGKPNRYGHALQAMLTGGWARVDASERRDRVTLMGRQKHKAIVTDPGSVAEFHLDQSAAK